MKKFKVLTKSHIIVAVMVVALGGAVWLNMRYSSAEKYLGEAKYVSKNNSSAVQTSAKVQSTDYFKDAITEREKMVKDVTETVTETLKSEKLTEQQKTEAVKKVKEIAARAEKENNIETLLKAKGFKKAVAVISEKGITAVVQSDGLTTAQTVQIQDIITGETDIELKNIKIVTVK